MGGVGRPKRQPAACSPSRAALARPREASLHRLELPLGSRPAGLATMWGRRKSAAEPRSGSRANANGITGLGPEVLARSARTL